MLEWRLKAYRHWLTMKEPTWANVHYPPIDYQKHQSTTRRRRRGTGPKSLDEVDPELLKTYEKLGIPLQRAGHARGRRRGRGFRQRLGRDDLQGEARRARASSSARSPKRSGSIRTSSSSISARVVPYSDNFFAALNSAVFSDGSFVYIPKGVRCPMELSTYFRINASNTGQFERTLIIADDGAYVSYLEGCTAPMRDENQLHAAVVELVALDDAQIKYSTVQNWYPGDKEGKGGIYNFVTKRGKCAGQALEDLVDAGRDRLRDHLEVPELHPAGRRLGRRVLLGGAREQPPAGRHRHEDDPHREEHAQHDRLEGDLRRSRTEHLPRDGQDPQGRGRRAQLLPVRLAPDGRQVRRAHLPVPRGRRTPRRSSSTRRRPRRSARTSSSTAGSAGSPPRTRSR